MANPVAVIVIPSEYLHHEMFEVSAQALQSHVYFGKAEIVKVVLDSSDKVTFGLRGKGGRFRWSDMEDLQTVVTISHGGFDGPVLFSGAAHHQPWYSAKPDDSTSYGFTRDGLHFWTSVKMALAGSDPWKPLAAKARKPKVILFGCIMGSATYCDSYAQKVAWATGVPTWGVTEVPGDASALCAPADWKTVVDVVSGIERGNVGTLFRRFKEFSPSATCAP